MAKIVILASNDDKDAISAALDKATFDYDIVDPTVTNLLQLAIGMVGDEPKEKKEEKPKDDKPKDEPADKPKDEPKDEVPPQADAPVEESLGTVLVNGELISAVKTFGPDSTLFVTSLISGARTSYTLDESVFSFWPADPVTPLQRVLVEHRNHKTSIQIKIQESKKNHSYLAVAADLADIFKA